MRWRQAGLSAAAGLGAGRQEARSIGAALVLLVAALAVFPFLGKEFMPTLQEGAIMFRVTGIPSTSLEEIDRVSQRIDAVLKQAIPAGEVGRWPPSAAPRRARRRTSITWRCWSM